jgi:hypothetical protein
MRNGGDKLCVSGAKRMRNRGEQPCVRAERCVRTTREKSALSPVFP